MSFSVYKCRYKMHKLVPRFPHYIILWYVVHPDTQCLQEVAFYVASNKGSVVLSCETMLALGLIQPHTSLDYLPPSTSLITSGANNPVKTKSQMDMQVVFPSSSYNKA